MSETQPLNSETPIGNVVSSVKDKVPWWGWMVGGATLVAIPAIVIPAVIYSKSNNEGSDEEKLINNED